MQARRGDASISSKARALIATPRKAALILCAMASTLAASGEALARNAVPGGSDTGWITLSDAASRPGPIVLHFRRSIDLARKPDRFAVQVTADNRFILYVNGHRLAAGPSTGDLRHWREMNIDLAPYMRPGRNVIAATVWNAVQPVRPVPGATAEQIKQAQEAARKTTVAPLFQQSLATGFRLKGTGEASPAGTDRAGWRVKRDLGHAFASGRAQLTRWYYAAGSPETIDAATATFDTQGAQETGEGWEDAAPLADDPARTIVADRLPLQSYAATEVGSVVRTDFAPGRAFPSRAVTIPPHSRVRLLLQRRAMVAAYPELAVAGGRGATIDVTYAEALYDADYRKGDRDLIEDRQAIGPHDRFIADGAQRTFAPLWWRTWRYLDVAIQTQDAPLTLMSMRAYATGYPFKQVGRFSSNDPDLSRIFEVGWRTARLGAHETYMDTPFWEQLQYAGDTRLQMLISYGVAADPRLAEQAIDAFAASEADGGLMQAAYPMRGSNVIPPFSLTWIGMLHDWLRLQPDPQPIVRNLGRMRQVLAWWDQHRSEGGLQVRAPYWNFIDWVGQAPNERDRFPSVSGSGESCLLTVLWLGALQQASQLEAAYGDAARGADDQAKAQSARTAIRSRCWAPDKGLYADAPNGADFSQHMNALAVLYDVTTPDEAPRVLNRIVAPGRGIDAPAGLSTTSYYFSWYLVQAFVHAGKGDRYVALLQTWRDLLRMNYTTWPEERDTAKASTRSDTHAWSAHPTADLLGVVAGVGPGAPGYAQLRIAPALGGLTKVDATAATPSGPVRVRYAVAGGQMIARIDRPAVLPGVFVWQGKSYPLTRASMKLTLPAPLASGPAR